MFKDGGGAHDGGVGNDGGLFGDEGCQGVVPTYFNPQSLIKC